MSQQQEQQVESNSSDDSGIDVKTGKKEKLKLHLKWNLI